MANLKPIIRSKKKQYLATLVTDKKAPCAFCHREVDDEITYGKLYAIGEIQCHYFCVLLSCCLIQKGKDEEGLFGFMYHDILAEIERSKKHRCSYCGKGGATLGCTVSQCRKQFHLPCGRQRNALSLFYGNYKSYCQQHAPKQKIPEHIMGFAKLRMKLKNGKVTRDQCLAGLKELKDVEGSEGVSEEEVDSICVICYEEVDGFPTLQTFWPPCCARDKWLHRSCVQRMALSAGMHYLKCPLCNDKDRFYDAVLDQGYYVPDRDAAWELEQNAFAEIYERGLSCGAEHCQCPNGRDYDSDSGMWDIKLCILCGTTCMHAQCMPDPSSSRFVCATCAPAAPSDLDSLAQSIEAVIEQEQSRAAESARHGPVMPCRMSLRRTKGRILYNNNRPSTSRKTEPDITASSRLELNLKTPKRPNELDLKSTNINNKLLSPLKLNIKVLSPLKLLEEGLSEKIKCLGVKGEVVSQSVVEKMKEKLKRPQPLSVKKRIVNEILDTIFDNTTKDIIKLKEPIQEWISPRKTTESQCDKENLLHTTPTKAVSLIFDIDSIGSKKPSTNRLRKNSKGRKDSESNSIEINNAKVNGEADKTSNEDSNKSDCKESDSDSKKSNGNKDGETDSKESDCKEPNSDPKKSNGNKDRKTDSKESDFKESDSDLKKSNGNEDVETDSKKPNEEKEFLNSTGAVIPSQTVDEEKPAKNKVRKSSLSLKKSVTKPKEETKHSEEVISAQIEEETQDCFEKSPVKLEAENVKVEDDSSTSTFQLPPEFIAETHSDESGSLSFETPRLKTVDIQKNSSLEISAIDETVNIDVIKMQENTNTKIFNNLKLPSPVKSSKCALKFSALDKETLEKKKMDIDIESFKNHYLNEVGKDFKCEFSHKHKHLATENTPVLRTAIDFAIDASKKLNKEETKKTERRRKLKRKLKTQDGVARKKKKGVKLVSKQRDFNNIELVCSEDKNEKKVIDLILDTPKSRKKNKKRRKNRQNIQVKIRWREERLKLRITQTKNRKKIATKEQTKIKQEPNKFKQYVLNYTPQISSAVNLVKPEQDITPKKRKYIKSEMKSPDNLVQTSIQSFFKATTSNSELCI